jgi:hypothetical protein
MLHPTNWSSQGQDQMGDESLSPAQKFEYRFLKQQVNSLEEERYRYDARPNIQQDLFHAREDLKSFVSKLRTNGVKI